jgi:hypothetical protein
VRDRLATLKSDWVALGRPVPAGMLAAACTAAETLTSAAGDRAVDAVLHHEQVLGGASARRSLTSDSEEWLGLMPECQPQDTSYRTSRPVAARPMIRRWISDVPSKIVKILASRCQRSTG